MKFSDIIEVDNDLEISSCFDETPGITPDAPDETDEVTPGEPEQEFVPPPSPRD